LTFAAHSDLQHLTHRAARRRLWEEIVCARLEIMSTNPDPGGVGGRIEEAVELIEMELRHAISYVNDAVVPQVRKESISALRTVADKLHDLANRFDENGSPRP
jgi:hypothetical protein